MPLISVILPAYNAEKYIQDAAISILNQTFTDIELIIVDDCSTDNTISLINEIQDRRLILLKQSENMGYPKAMNAGITIAKGKYLARMDADDICEPDRLQLQYDLHESNPHVAFVSSLRYWLTPNGKKFTRRNRSYKPEKAWFSETWDQLMSGQRQFTDPASFVLTKRVRAVGGYRTYQRSGMDVDLWLRLMEHTQQPMLTLTKPIYGKRLIPNAIIFKPQTNQINQIPRLLAKERVEAGIDRIAKGLSLEDFEMEAAQLASQSNQVQTNLRFLSTHAAYCMLAMDLRGAIVFLNKANESRVNQKWKSVWMNFLYKTLITLIRKEIIRLP